MKNPAIGTVPAPRRLVWLLAAAAVFSGGCRPAEPARPPIPVQVATLQPRADRLGDALQCHGARAASDRVVVQGSGDGGRVDAGAGAGRQAARRPRGRRGGRRAEPLSGPARRLGLPAAGRGGTGSAGEAQAKERAAAAAVTALRATFERIKALRERESVAQQTYDDTLAKRDSAEAELEPRGARSAGRVALQQAEDDLTALPAGARRFPGAVVSRKYVERGERVPAGQPVFEIMDLSRVRVAFGVPDTRIGQFQIGQAVR